MGTTAFEIFDRWSIGPLKNDAIVQGEKVYIIQSTSLKYVVTKMFEQNLNSIEVSSWK